jgi:hypothetical protein
LQELGTLLDQASTRRREALVELDAAPPCGLRLQGEIDRRITGLESAGQHDQRIDASRRIKLACLHDKRIGGSRLARTQPHVDIHCLACACCALRAARIEIDAQDVARRYPRQLFRDRRLGARPFTIDQDIARRSGKAATHLPVVNGEARDSAHNVFGCHGVECGDVAGFERVRRSRRLLLRGGGRSRQRKGQRQEDARGGSATPEFASGHSFSLTPRAATRN